MRNILILTLALAVVACGDNDTAPIELDNGAACSADSEDEVCTDPAFCLEEFENGTVVSGGMCTNECMWNADQTDTCEDGEICLRYNPTQEFVCFMGCESDADCRVDDGWGCECLDFFCGEKACIPDLTPPDEATALRVPILFPDMLYDTAMEARLLE